MTSETFDYTGSQQTVTVPDWAYQATVECWGAGGGAGGDGGAGRSRGGYARGAVSVSPGETLYLYVGGQGGNGNATPNQSGGGEAAGGGGGWNGGAKGGDAYSDSFGTRGSGGGGGGGTDVRRGGTALADRVIVAGGGGGAGGGSFGRGGDGGGTTGEDGHHNESDIADGQGGTQSAGGTGVSNGSLGSGGAGDGFTSWNPSDHTAGGGGGGGYYGGGGGEGESSGAASGGGGSGYVSGSTTQLSTAGGNTGHGTITVTWPERPNAPTNVHITGERETELDLAWDAVSDADGYTIYRAQSPGTTLSDYTEIDSTTAEETTYTDTSLLHGTAYYYRVTATKSETSPSDPSAEFSGTTEIPDVTGLAFDARVEDEFTVSWDAVLNTGQYRVEYRITDSGGAFALAGEQPHTDTEITIGGLRDGERYDIRIRGQT